MHEIRGNKEGIEISLPKKNFSRNHRFVALQILHRMAISVFENNLNHLREREKLRQCIGDIGE